MITRNGGWFGSAHHARAVQPDAALWPSADFDTLAEAFRITGFRPGNSWYLNESANITHAQEAPDGGRLRQPVGDRWLTEKRSLLLRVPSVLVPETRNLLINPQHAEASSLKIAAIYEHASTLACSDLERSESVLGSAQ